MITAIRRWQQRSRHDVDHAILCALDDGNRWFLFRLCDRVGMGTGRVSRALPRLYANGWIEYGREAAGTVYPPPLPGRRWYRITAEGHRQLSAEEQR